MRKIRLILLVFLWMATILAAVQPYIGNKVASYLIIFTLVIVPLSLVNGLILGVLIYKNSSSRYLHGFFTLISFYLFSKTFSIPFFLNNKSGHSVVCLTSCNVENFLLNMKVLQSTSVTIARLNSDIVCLQERPHTSLLSCDSIFKEFHYNYVTVNDREDEVLNLAILSKWPLINKKEFYFTDSYNKFIRVDIKHPDRIVRLFNVHLQTTGISQDAQVSAINQLCQHAWLRNLQADKLSEEIKRSPYPVIVCGDFNDTPLSYVYHKVSHRLSDSFKESGTGWGGTFQSLGNLFRIDYILCSPELKVKNYRLIKNHWSDHKIQFSELEFTSLQ